MNQIAVHRDTQHKLRSLDEIEAADYGIRLASERDIEHIRAIEAKAEYREFIGMWLERQYREALADPAQEVAVAVRDGEAVAGFYVLRDIGGKDRCLNLMRIAVEEPGCGVGGRLLRCAISRAFEHHNAHRLWLDVFTKNRRAKQVYRKQGFVEEGVLRDVKLRDGFFQSQMIMSMLEHEYRGRN